MQATTLRRMGMLLGGAALCLILPHPAVAQTTDAAATGLGEIVVTAEKRVGNVQKTPIAIDVYSGADLGAQGVKDITSLAYIAPAVNVTGNSGGGTVVTVRGISSRDTTEVGDPAVSISVDGFYQDRSYAIGLTQYDLDRIEVLKGPQGTLYGRNATGGAINIITKQPGLDYGGYATVEAGNYNTLNAEGAVNVPLGDKVQARASFSSIFHDGYRDGGAAGDFDDANSRSGRLQFSAQPSEDLRLHVLAQVTSQRSSTQGAFQTPYLTTPINATQGGVLHVLPTNLPSDPTEFTMPAEGKLKLTDRAYRWGANYDGLPFGDFVYLGGYDDLKWDQLSPSWFFGVANGAPATQTRQYNQTENPKTVNHEIRLASKNPDAMFSYQAGVFYFKDENTLDSFNRQTNGLGVIHFIYKVNFESVSEFAQVSFKPTEQLKLTAGIRHNEDKKDRDGTITSFNGLGVANPTGISKASTDASKNTYHAGVDYQINSDSLLYAKYDTGYKAAGFTDIAPYGPENMKAWEIGTKNRFFDNMLQLNAAYFHSTYEGQQVQQIVQGGGGLRIVNAGETEINGVEADVQTLTPVGRFNLNAQWLDAQFTDFALAYAPPIYNLACNTAATPYAAINCWSSGATTNVQLSGNRPPQAPEWTLGASWEKDFDVPGGRLTPQLQMKYSGDQYFSFFNRVTDLQKAYTVTNFNLTYAPTDANWDAQIYVRNLTDETVFSNALENDRSFAYTYSYQAPRTYGLRLSARW